VTGFGLMQIWSRQLIKDFIKRYPLASAPLKRWEIIVEGVEWRKPADVKQTFSSASFVGATTVFNIGGNKWRLLSHIQYEDQVVVITGVVTHKEYDGLKIG
jgi:mRNA interferase HigB